MIEIDKIYNEDCLEGMKRIDDFSVDLVLCDPPYGTTSCAWDSVIPLEPMWEQFKRVTKPTAPMVLFGSQPFTSLLITSNLEEYREELVWLKNRPPSGLNKNSRHMKIHENIEVFSKEGKYTFNPQKWLVEAKEFLTQRKTFIENEYIGENLYGTTKRTRQADDGTRYPISIVSSRLPQSPSYSKRYKQGTEVRIHPTQKPVELMRYLTRTFSNPGDVILDPCMGSGSTAVAALMEGRHFIGFETDKGYYDKAVERIEKLRRNPTLF